MTGPDPGYASGRRPSEISTPDATPASAWEQEAAKRALDELFSLPFNTRPARHIKSFCNS